MNADAARDTQVPDLSWVPFFEALGRRLLDYESRQQELITYLEELRSKGLRITALDDKSATGRRSLLKEIDPFTFVGVLNRGITNKMRRRIADEFADFFGLGTAAPKGFDGIPVVNNQSSWFFSYADKRQPGDIPALWKLLRLSQAVDPWTEAGMAEAFDDALEVRGVNVNLTMGLFWVQPKRFLSLDSVMRQHLGIELPAGGLTFEFYRNTTRRVLAEHPEGFPALSYRAWLDVNEPPPPQPGPPPQRDYWMVGAWWSSREPQDQTTRFLEEGTWENGYHDRYLDLVRAMKPGDRIAIKATSTQKDGLPFDSRGNTASKMTIKATGTITKNLGDGQSVEVEWDAPATSRDWYFYTYRGTVWRLAMHDDLAQRLARFAFEGEAQDYEFFCDQWWGQRGPGRDTPRPPRPQAYGIDDMLAEGVFLPRNRIVDIVARWHAKKALILQGAPGVGKTFLARKLAFALMEEVAPERLTVVQFHPSYSYEDFVRGFRPTDAAGKFALVDGSLLTACGRAENDPDNTHVVVLDEVNRGNTSQVFGELLMLLEPDKRGRENAVTPLYPRGDGDKLWIPENLYFLGTMNVADRSLALVDYALRRRFAFIDLEPMFGAGVFEQWLTERKMAPALVQLIVQRMLALNSRIAASRQLGPSFRVGHSFFCPRGDDFSTLDHEWYRQVVETEIIPLLREYWYDDRDAAQSAAGELLAG